MCGYQTRESKLRHFEPHNRKLIKHVSYSSGKGCRCISRARRGSSSSSKSKGMVAAVQDVDVELQLGTTDEKLHGAAKDVLQRLLPEWRRFDQSDIKVHARSLEALECGGSQIALLHRLGALESLQRGRKTLLKKSDVQMPLDLRSTSGIWSCGCGSLPPVQCIHVFDGVLVAVRLRRRRPTLKVQIDFIATLGSARLLLHHAAVVCCAFH